MYPPLVGGGYRQGHQLPHGRYERNTLNVGPGLPTILEAPIKPRAIIMIGAYAACAKFIRIARRALPETIYLNVSFVGSMALKNALGPDGEGVIVTQVVPHFESDVSLTPEYHRDLKDYAPEADPGFVSLAGYIVARIFVEGLRRARPDVDRTSTGRPSSTPSSASRIWTSAWGRRSVTPKKCIRGVRGSGRR
jgi:ABC-type branched-subunit amino acid transport system substrate-binding protein